MLSRLKFDNIIPKATSTIPVITRGKLMLQLSQKRNPSNTEPGIEVISEKEEKLVKQSRTTEWVNAHRKKNYEMYVELHPEKTENRRKLSDITLNRHENIALVQAVRIGKEHRSELIDITLNQTDELALVQSVDVEEAENQRKLSNITIIQTDELALVQAVDVEEAENQRKLSNINIIQTDELAVVQAVDVEVAENQRTSSELNDITEVVKDVQQSTVEDEIVQDSYDSEEEIPYLGLSKSQPLSQNTLMLKVSKVDKAAGKRVWDKIHACFFCSVLIKNKISEHLTNVHDHELKVARILALKKGSKERKLGWERIQNLGDFNHNIAVLQANHGELIVKRRSVNRDRPDDFLPCEFCYGFFCASLLWQHQKSCHCNSASHENRKPYSVIAASRVLLESTNSYASETRDPHLEEILSSMRRDQLSLIVKGDKIILTLGSVLVRKLSTAKCHLISQKMRELARLKMQLILDSKSENLQLIDYVSGVKFNSVIHAIEGLCVCKSDEVGYRLFEKPSLALKLGHSLQRLAQIKKGIAIRQSDEIMRQEAEAFLSLHASEFTDLISTTALNTLRHNKMSQEDMLPVAEDLIQLKKYQEQQLAMLTIKLQSNPDYQTYRLLLEVVLSRITIFNRRRGGEASRLLLSAYTDRPNWQETANSDIIKSLHPLERELAKRFVLFFVVYNN